MRAVLVMVFSMVLTAAFGLVACGPSGAPAAGSSAVASESGGVDFAEVADEPGADARGIEQSAAARELQGELEQLVASSGLDAGVSYVSLVDSRDRCSVGGDEPRVAASVIKLAVLAEVLDQAGGGFHPLEEPLQVQESDIVAGTGVVQGMGAGTVLTVGELAGYMISESDNTAANILIDAVGMDAVNENARKLGLDNTALKRKMMDEQAIAEGVENMMSANDAARILELTYKGGLVDAKMSAFALDTLKAQGIAGGIGAGLPPGIPVAHKTGSLANIENDAAIVLAERPYVLVVMASGGSGNAMQLASDASAIVWAHVQER